MEKQLQLQRAGQDLTHISGVIWMLTLLPVLLLPELIRLSQWMRTVVPTATANITVNEPTLLNVQASASPATVCEGTRFN